MYGSAEVVKRGYRSNSELFNLIDFQKMIRREFDYKGLGFKDFKTIIIKGALGLLVHHNNKSFTNKS